MQGVMQGHAPKGTESFGHPGGGYPGSAKPTPHPPTMPLVAPPIDLVRTVQPYTEENERPRAASAHTDAVHFKQLLRPGTPFILHLYTP